MNYIGRFAPSPTGPLHFGSLIAAVASYCDAQANNGKWLVRMEDLDKPREMAGAANSILKTLEAFGFSWDGEIMYQSHRMDAYESALESLRRQGVIYPCTCSRKEIADSATSTGIEGAIYPGTCLKHATQANIHAALRAMVPDESITFHDQIQGIISQNLARDIGDFVVKRADGLFAYQLAVVVDDAEQGITHIVRGSDLIDSTSRQIFLQRLLGYQTPRYAHVPVAANANGEKLSKQTMAKAIMPGVASNLLFEALTFLGQQPPAVIKNATTSDVWRWAFAHWQLNNVPKLRRIIIED